MMFFCAAGRAIEESMKKASAGDNFLSGNVDGVPEVGKKDNESTLPASLQLENGDGQ